MPAQRPEARSIMTALTQAVSTPAPDEQSGGLDDSRADRALGAAMIIANAPDPVFVSDLEGSSRARWSWCWNRST